MKGELAEEKYFSQLVNEKNWDSEAAEIRRRKTRRLLAQDPKTLFSEVQILANGQLFIHDGYHRAAVRAESGLASAKVQVSLSLFLR